MKSIRIRFRTRHLLIAMTLISLFLSYVASIVSSLTPSSRHYWAIYRQHHAAISFEPISEHRWLHGILPRDYVREITTVLLYKPQHDDHTLSELIPHMNAFDGFRQLALQHSAVTDAGLSKLANLNNLQTLELKGKNFSDAGVLHIAKLEKLEQLNIEMTKITQQGV